MNGPTNHSPRLYTKNEDAIVEPIVESLLSKHDDQETSKAAKKKGRKEKIKRAITAF